jgi:hypothetical protein
MYRDIHRLLGEAQFVENAASAVMHFAREVKGTVEKVLLPSDFERPEKGGNAAAIAAILKLLDLPLDHQLAKLWKELDPHKLVHRRALGRPLSLEEVRGKFGEFEVIIEVLLEELERAFVPVIYAKLDVLLAKELPGRSDVSVLRNQIPQNSQALQYFFGKASVDRWLEPRTRKGCSRMKRRTPRGPRCVSSSAGRKRIQRASQRSSARSRSPSRRCIRCSTSTCSKGFRRISVLRCTPVWRRRSRAHSKTSWRAVWRRRRETS